MQAKKMEYARRKTFLGPTVFFGYPSYYFCGENTFALLKRGHYILIMTTIDVDDAIENNDSG